MKSIKFIMSCFFAIILFSSFVFSIGVSPESVMIEIQRDEVHTQEIVLYVSGELETEGETDMLFFNIIECNDYCVGNITIDSRYQDPGEYREELIFYDRVDGNINSGVILPVRVKINPSEFSLIKKVKDDKVVVGFFIGMLLLVILLGIFVFKG